MHHVSKQGDCVDFGGGAICPRLASSDALSKLSHFESYTKIRAHCVGPHRLTTHIQHCDAVNKQI